MTNKNQTDKHGFKRMANTFDRLIMTAFALGVVVVITLFIYVLSTGSLAKP